MIRLNKFISDAGICSRREADRKIESGKVRVNGRVASLGDMVTAADKVLVDGNPVEFRSQRVYLAYHKPEGVTSTTDKSDPDNIIKAVGYHGGRIFPIGRLDKDSEGLILLTDDGDIVNKILRVSNRHDKEYIVSVDAPITSEFVQKMASGVSILGIMTRKCTVEKINSHTFRIILNQGLNRQIRRMCKVLGYKVTRLQRVRIMHIRLDGIPPGAWIFLPDEDVRILMAEVAGSHNQPSRSSSSEKPAFKPKKTTRPDQKRVKKSASADKKTGDKRGVEKKTGPKDAQKKAGKGPVKGRPGAAKGGVNAKGRSGREKRR